MYAPTGERIACYKKMHPFRYNGNNDSYDETRTILPGNANGDANGDALQSLILRANEGRQRVGNLHSHPNKKNGKTIDESISQWTF